VARGRREIRGDGETVARELRVELEAEELVDGGEAGVAGDLPGAAQWTVTPRAASA
jgi:hypothetical protein